MAFKSGSYQQLTTIPTSPHDDLYMFLDSSQNGVFDSDTGITSSTTAPTRITRSNGIRFSYSSSPRVAVGQDRLVIMQEDWTSKDADSDAFFHIYNLGYYNTQTDSGVLTVLKDSTLTEFESYSPNADHPTLSDRLCAGGPQPQRGDLRIGNNRIVVSGNWEYDSDYGMAGIYDLKGKLIKFLYKDRTIDSKTSGYFGHSIDVGSGRILVGDYRYEDSNADSIGACFMYDLNGNHIKTIRPPSSHIDTTGYFGRKVRVDGPSIVISQRGYTGSVGDGVVHIYNLNGIHKHTIEPQDASTSLFGSEIDANEGIIAIQATNGGEDHIEVYDHNGTFIGSSKDTNEANDYYRYPEISDGRIVVRNIRNSETWHRLAILKRDAGASTGVTQIQNVLPPSDLQAGYDVQNWANSFSASSGKIAVALDPKNATVTSGSDYDDSASGVYLFDIPKQKNLTNLLDDF